MITDLLKIQYKRGYRTLKELGFPPITTICCIPIVLVYFSNLILSKYKNGYIVLIITGVWLLLQLSDKQRNRFLKQICTKGEYLKIRIIENIITIFPFVIILMTNTYYKAGILLIITSIIFTKISSILKTSFVIPTPFSKHPFEFSVGFRKFYWAYIICYTLTAMAVYAKNFNLGIVSLGALLLTISAFYEKTEPKIFVWFFNIKPKQFLAQKTKRLIIYSFWSCIPIHLTLWFMIPTKFHISLLVHLAGIIYCISIIFTKYKHFPRKMIIGDLFIITLCLLFPPLYIIITPKYYKEAIQNLNKIL